MRPPTAIRTTSNVKLLCLQMRASFVCRIVVNYNRLFLDMVGTKHCSWGRCNMDSRYPDTMPQSKNYKNRAKKCSFHLPNHGMIPNDARNGLMLALERTLRLKVSPRIRIFVLFIGQKRKDPQKSSLIL